MAQAPHDKAGRVCSACKAPFVKGSYFGSIITKQGGFYVQRIVCRSCHNAHFSKGE